MALNLDWRKEGSFRAPSPLDPCIGNIKRNAEMASELSYATANSINREIMVETGVLLLLQLGLPLAVARFVIAVIINSSKSQTLRAFTHILQKVLKLQPGLAYLNAPPSVTWKGSVIGILASLKHHRPSFVGGGLGEVSGVSVYFRHGIGSFSAVFSGGWRVDPSLTAL